MDWLNLHSSVLDSVEFVGSEPIDRATWLCLLRYCAGQENGGEIADCRDWTDRKWQQIARITKAEVERVSALWTWRGKTLCAWGYPMAAQKTVQRLRKQSKGANKARWNGADKPPIPDSPPTYTRRGKALVGEEVIDK